MFSLDNFGVIGSLFVDCFLFDYLLFCFIENDWLIKVLICEIMFFCVYCMKIVLYDVVFELKFFVGRLL